MPQQSPDDDVVVVKHIPGPIDDECDTTRYDILFLCGFIVIVIVVATILRLALQVTRARMITDQQRQPNRDEISSPDGSMLSLVLRR